MANTLVASQTAGAFNAGILNTVFSSADGTNGNSFVNTGRTVLLVNNGSGGSINVVFAIPSSPRTLNGQVGSTQTKAVPAGDIGFFGTFDPGAFTNNSGLVNISFSSATSVTIAVVELALSPTP